MKNYLSDHLISPDNGTALQFDHARHHLLSADGNYAYEIEDGIPVLLPEDAEQRVLNTPLHERCGTNFYYLTHYRADAEHFDYSKDFDDGAARHEERRLHEAIIEVVPADARRILDVGCGKAWVAQHFCPQGVAVCSMDASLTNPRRALQQHPFPNHSAVVADVFNLPFRENAFDAIIAAEVIEHVPDPNLFVQRLLTALRPGGVLVITAPYREHRQFTLCVHCNNPTPLHAHLHVFDEENLRALVAGGQARPLFLRTFSNKALARLKTHLLLQFLPWRLWRRVDRLANRLYRQPTRVMMVVEKGEMIDY
jgi:2-polyprenyl-3-methyl-5-hydroxy-6-metoxy-1,4-benzoquinol methylase